MGASFVLLAISYAVYSLEQEIHWARPVETVLDLSLAAIVVITTIIALLQELKRGGF
jgi:hypothetical protein